MDVISCEALTPAENRVGVYKQQVSAWRQQLEKPERLITFVREATLCCWSEKSGFQWLFVQLRTMTAEESARSEVQALPLWSLWKLSIARLGRQVMGSFLKLLSEESVIVPIMGNRGLNTSVVAPTESTYKHTYLPSNGPLLLSKLPQRDIQWTNQGNKLFIDPINFLNFIWLYWFS